MDIDSLESFSLKMNPTSLDLEDCNNFFKGFIGTIFNEDKEGNRKSQPYSYMSSNSLYDLPIEHSDYGSDYSGVMEQRDEDFFEPPVADIFDSKKNMYDPAFGLAAFGFSGFSDFDPEFFLVSPDAVLPSPLQREDITSLETVWPDFEASDTKVMKYADEEYFEDEYISLDNLNLLIKNKGRKFTHLDIDHCYSQRPPVQYDDDDDNEEEDEEYFDSSPYSPASSSCSDRLVAVRGVKRTRPKRKIVRRKRIKKEMVSSSESEEVDVETPCAIPPLVPKITIAITPPLTPPTLPAPTPPKRGRKPKDKSKGPNVEKPNNKNCPVSPKVLQAAIKQEKKKSYVTKSGRVTKISNSVETTPSTSTPSSANNSRYNSDNEDTVDKRASHNMAERNRRQELTNLFQQLREKVPEIRKNTKASKVAILQSSTAYIVDLEEVERQKELLKEQLRAELEHKLALVQSLKSSRGCSS